MSPEQTRKCHALFDKYQRLMIGIALDVLRDAYLAEDAVQEAFICVIKNIEKIGEIDCPKTRNFLAIIVKNIARTEYRKRKGMEYVQDPESLEEFLPADPGLPAEVKLHWEESLRQLGAQYQEVLLLTMYGYNLKDISEILNENYETVRKRLYRAREALKKIL